jgi:uncharacterized protein
MRFFCLAALLLSLNISAAQQPSLLKTNADDNTLLWEISGNGITAPSYLFGTFHLLCKDQIRFSNTLTQAVSRAAEVYMELDMDDPATMLGGLGLMNMKNGGQLKDLFTEDEYRRVETYFKDSLKSALAFFKGIKPMVLSSLIYPKLLPCSGVTSVEEQLVKLAKRDKKEVEGLETLAFQASVFDSIPYKDQADELLKTIDSISKSKIFFDSMVRVYLGQDMGAIEKMLTADEFGMAGGQDVLLYNRNLNWVQQLKKIMTGKPVFVAVGAGHLPGKNGLIDLLRKEGYTVRPLENR